MIVHVSKDLMLTSQVSGACGQHARTYKSVSRLELLADVLGDASGVLVDLQMSGFDQQEFNRLVAAAEPKPKLIAYAQHVEVQLLEDAADTFDVVMTRGQFHSSVAQIVQSL